MKAPVPFVTGGRRRKGLTCALDLLCQRRGPQGARTNVGCPHSEDSFRTFGRVCLGGPPLADWQSSHVPAAIRAIEHFWPAVPASLSQSKSYGESHLWVVPVPGSPSGITTSPGRHTQRTPCPPASPSVVSVAAPRGLLSKWCLAPYLLCSLCC